MRDTNSRYHSVRVIAALVLSNTVLLTNSSFIFVMRNASGPLKHVFFNIIIILPISTLFYHHSSIPYLVLMFVSVVFFIMLPNAVLDCCYTVMLIVTYSVIHICIQIVGFPVNSLSIFRPHN